MSTFRIQKTSNYTVMSNHHLREKNMSLKAIGLLSKMLSLPDDWDYSMAGLCAICKENETAIRSAIKELKEFGYLRMVKHHINGQYEWEYLVFEEPQPPEVQGIENLHIENQGVENLPIYKDTKEVSTQKEITKISPSGGTTPLIPQTPKKDKKSKDIATMRSMISAFTENAQVRKALTTYLAFRMKRGLSLEQWQIILDDLRTFAGDDGDLALEKINGAIAGGYSTIIAAWEKTKQRAASKPKFDNLGGRSVPSVASQPKKIATDGDGNPLKF